MTITIILAMQEDLDVFRRMQKGVGRQHVLADVELCEERARFCGKQIRDFGERFLFRLYIPQ
jgi:hypothetical protein